MRMIVDELKENQLSSTIMRRLTWALHYPDIKSLQELNNSKKDGDFIPFRNGPL